MYYDIVKTAYRQYLDKQKRAPVKCHRRPLFISIYIVRAIDPF